MNMARFLAAAGLALAGGCANFPVPLSTTDPPPPNARVDSGCMQDCLGQNGNAEFCHSRCAK